MKAIKSIGSLIWRGICLWGVIATCAVMGAVICLWGVGGEQGRVGGI